MGLLTAVLLFTLLHIQGAHSAYLASPPRTGSRKRRAGSGSSSPRNQRNGDENWQLGGEWMQVERRMDSKSEERGGNWETREEIQCRWDYSRGTMEWDQHLQQTPASSGHLPFTALSPSLSSLSSPWELPLSYLHDWLSLWMTTQSSF